MQSLWLICKSLNQVQHKPSGLKSFQVGPKSFDLLVASRTASDDDAAILPPVQDVRIRGENMPLAETWLALAKARLRPA